MDIYVYLNIEYTVYLKFSRNRNACKYHLYTTKIPVYQYIVALSDLIARENPLYTYCTVCSYLACLIISRIRIATLYLQAKTSDCSKL